MDEQTPGTQPQAPQDPGVTPTPDPATPPAPAPEQGGDSPQPVAPEAPAPDTGSTDGQDPQQAGGNVPPAGSPM